MLECYLVEMEGGEGGCLFFFYCDCRRKNLKQQRDEL